MKYSIKMNPEAPDDDGLVTLRVKPGTWAVYSNNDTTASKDRVFLGIADLCDHDDAKLIADALNAAAAAPALLSALEDVELRATQARLASAIGKKSGVKQADFLRGELDRIGQAARAAITKAQEMKTP